MGVTIGIKTLKYAPVGAGGAPGTPTTEVKTLQDSLTFNAPDTTQVNVNIDQSSVPIYSKQIINSKTFTFTIPNPDNDTRKDFMGGTVTSGTSGDKWTPPTSDPDIHMTIEITPASGNVRTYNDCTITAYETGNLGKTNNLGLVVTCSVNVPTDGSSPEVEIKTQDYAAE